MSGGKMSIFLMGVYDPDKFRWCTVTKCGNGLDDKLINRLQRELVVKKINRVGLRLIACAWEIILSLVCLFICCSGLCMWLGGRVVRTLDLRSVGHEFESWSLRYRVQPGQVVNTHVPLSPSSVIWYQPMCGDALRLGR